MTDGLFNLDTTQGSGTIDGDLYTAITNIGWGGVISNQLLKLKELLTNTISALNTLYKTNNLRYFKFIDGSHSYGSGITILTAVQDWVADGKLPLNETFVFHMSMGANYWGIGYFYKSNNKTYGSILGGTYNYVFKIICNGDAWTYTNL